MKQIIGLFCALALLLTLGACGVQPAPEPSENLATPEPTAEVTPEPAPENDGSAEAAEAPVPAILSPGAAESSELSKPFQTLDGELFTGAATGDGFVFLGDVLPIGESYVSSLLFTDRGTLAVVKEYFFSMDPSQLVLYPADGGEPEILADGLVPSSRIALAGDALFFLEGEEPDNGTLIRLDLTTGETETVSEGVAGLSAASGGFVYYEKDGALYRNDSTAAAEAKLFSTAGVVSVATDGDDLCLLLGGDGSLEFRKADGSLSARVALEESADNILCRDGKLYVPQVYAGSILVFDLATAEALDPIVPGTLGTTCLLHEVTDDALYYETVLETGLALCRVPLDGGTAEVVGSIIL